MHGNRRNSLLKRSPPSWCRTISLLAADERRRGLSAVAKDGAGHVFRCIGPAVNVHQRAACGALVARFSSCLLASMAASGNLRLDAADAGGMRDVDQREHRARRLQRRHDVVLVVLYVFRAVLREAGGRLDDLEPDAAVPRAVDDGSELLRHRRQAGQRADRGAGVPAGVLHLAGDVPGGENDDRHGRRACRRWKSWTTKKCWSGRTWSTPS